MKIPKKELRLLDQMCSGVPTPENVEELRAILRAINPEYFALVEAEATFRGCTPEDVIVEMAILDPRMNELVPECVAMLRREVVRRLDDDD